MFKQKHSVLELYNKDMSLPIAVETKNEMKVQESKTQVQESKT